MSLNWDLNMWFDSVCTTLICDILLPTRVINYTEDLFVANKPGNAEKIVKNCNFLNFNAS